MTQAPGNAATPLWRRVLSTVLVIAYPAVVYVGLREGQPRLVAAAVLVLLLPGVLARLTETGVGKLWSALRPVAPTFVLVAIVAAIGDGRLLLVVPVVVSVGLLFGFAATLRPGATSMVERFARVMEPELPPGGVEYCRTVTKVWCAFFVLNAGAAGALAAWDTTWWALYTGVVAYILIGALFTMEYVVRKARFRRYGSSVPDRILARVFPPQVTPS